MWHWSMTIGSVALPFQYCFKSEQWVFALTHTTQVTKKDYLKKLDTEKDYTALAFNYVAS